MDMDTLLGKHCSALMRMISFIYERKVIKKILDHPGLYKEQNTTGWHKEVGGFNAKAQIKSFWSE